MTKQKKEDIAANPIYRLIARYTLNELHGNLMKNLYGHFMGRQGKHTLVVAGQGPEVVPFSRNLDLVEEMIGDGNIAMFDYNPDIIATSKDALLHPRFDSDETVPERKRKGIEERGYNLIDINPEKTVNLKEIGERKIIVRQGDLSDKFKFEDNSVSAFDSTLAIHHVTAYRQGLDHVIDEVYRILEPEGMFHWGAGNVDMRYQEEKIHRVASELAKFYATNVVLEDRRDPSTGSNNIMARAFYSSKPCKRVPLVDEQEYAKRLSESDNPIKVEITKDGGITVNTGNREKADELKLYLHEKGFKQVHTLGKSNLILPIIDQGMREDRELHLESVRNYYTGIINLNKESFADKPDVAAKVYDVANNEFGNSSRGLFEYYTEPKMLMNILQEKGFRNVTYESDARGIWCNITAIKG